jgi:benzodiazapine receptor
MGLIVFLLYLAACLVAGATGVLFPPGSWYDSLDKPKWTPPNWMFPVVWAVLYLLMSWAAVIVTNSLSGDDASRIGLSFWSLQITLNALWTPVFFGLRRIGSGLLVMVPLWLAVAGTMVTFFMVNLLAGLLFVPYLVWVTMAASLNYAIWRRNPTPEPVDLDV